MRPFRRRRTICDRRIFSSCTWSLPFWAKPVSVFGLFLVTTVTVVHFRSSVHPTLAPDRLDAGSRKLSSQSACYPVGYGYVVPGASHPAVASNARPGRVLVAEHQVMFLFVKGYNSSSSDFVSRGDCQDESFKSGNYPFGVFRRVG